MLLSGRYAFSSRSHRIRCSCRVGWNSPLPSRLMGIFGWEAMPNRGRGYEADGRRRLLRRRCGEQLGTSYRIFARGILQRVWGICRPFVISGKRVLPLASCSSGVVVPLRHHEIWPSVVPASPRRSLHLGVQSLAPSTGVSNAFSNTVSDSPAIRDARITV